MWLSRQRQETAVKEAVAESGPVTLLDRQAAVYLEGERRNVAMCGPVGLTWRPKVGQQVLVLKAGQEQERPFILGQDCTALAEGLAPGEVLLGTEQVGVRCGDSVALTGQVLVNGESLEALILRLTTPPPVAGG